MGMRCVRMVLRADGLACGWSCMRMVLHADGVACRWCWCCVRMVLRADGLYGDMDSCRHWAQMSVKRKQKNKYLLKPLHADTDRSGCGWWWTWMSVKKREKKKHLPDKMQMMDADGGGCGWMMKEQMVAEALSRTELVQCSEHG